MSGIVDIPKTKWVDSGAQPILKVDFTDIETALLQIGARISPPNIRYNDSTSVVVDASADCPVGVYMSGFSNVYHPGMLVDAGLTDGQYRENTSNATMDFDTGSTFWGVEKSSQWYAVYAVADDADDTFTLMAMPYLRVSSLNSGTDTISLRNNLNSADRGYGFSTNELADYKIYFLSGASKGLLLTVTANDNTNSESSAGTITYSGSDPTVSQGDWFILLPSDVNFRWLGDLFNDDSANVQNFIKRGHMVEWYSHVDVTSETAAVKVASVSPLAVRGVFAGKYVSTGGGNSYTAGFQNPLTSNAFQNRSITENTNSHTYYIGADVGVSNCQYTLDCGDITVYCNGFFYPLPIA